MSKAKRKQAMEEVAEAQGLPDDLWTYLFSYTDMETKRVSELACQAFRQLVWTPTEAIETEDDASDESVAYILDHNRGLIYNLRRLFLLVPVPNWPKLKLRQSLPKTRLQHVSLIVPNSDVAFQALQDFAESGLALTTLQIYVDEENSKDKPKMAATLYSRAEAVVPKLPDSLRHFALTARGASIPNEPFLTVLATRFKDSLESLHVNCVNWSPLKIMTKLTYLKISGKDLERYIDPYELKASIAEIQSRSPPSLGLHLTIHRPDQRDSRTLLRIAMLDRQTSDIRAVIEAGFDPFLLTSMPPATNFAKTHIDTALEAYSDPRDFHEILKTLHEVHKPTPEWPYPLSKCVNIFNKVLVHRKWIAEEESAYKPLVEFLLGEPWRLARQFHSARELLNEVLREETMPFVHSLLERGVPTTHIEFLLQNKEIAEEMLGNQLNQQGCNPLHQLISEEEVDKYLLVCPLPRWREKDLLERNAIGCLLDNSWHQSVILMLSRLSDEEFIEVCTSEPTLGESLSFYHSPGELSAFINRAFKLLSHDQYKKMVVGLVRADFHFYHPNGTNFAAALEKGGLPEDIKSVVFEGLEKIKTQVVGIPNWKSLRIVFLLSASNPAFFKGW